MNQRRDDDSAERCKNRQQRVFDVRQFADLELAYEFQPDQQKEDRHQKIVDPQLDAQTRDVRMPEMQVIFAQKRIRREQWNNGADDQQDAARLFRVEKFLECSA